MENGSESRAVTEVPPAVYVWASVGTSDSPPDRIRVESCADCGSLVPVATFDRHGVWHAELERMAMAER